MTGIGGTADHQIRRLKADVLNDVS